ncbi:MAG: DUF4910 domain-containing protein [Bacteroidales bacterium]|nr:DUF4910 domain-containing protein [Bacteroidales bacterium]
MKKFYFSISLILFTAVSLFSQDSDLYKEVISELNSKKYYGRGYYKNGDGKAASYIAKTFREVGAEAYNENYFQEFAFPVNVFQGKMKMSIDGMELLPAKDFVLREFSSGIKGEYDLYYLDTTNFDIELFKKEYEKEEVKNSAIVIDFSFFHQHGKELGFLYKSQTPAIILKWSEPLKFYKAYSSFIVPIGIVWVSPNFPDNAKSVKFNIENNMIDEHKTKNVVAFVEGSHAADSFYVFTAHYDHLGMMGKKVYFPGANDNASGVAMLVSLAEHYANPENQPKYSMLFVAVAGEETGLLGSKHFVENPIIPLNNIKYVLNFDMIADNSEDIYVEISDEGQKGLDLLNEINSVNSFFTELEQGELAGNSDHFSFAEKDVPAVFFMMKGDGWAIYHTPQDNFQSIDLNNYPKLFKLVQEFIINY